MRRHWRLPYLPRRLRPRLRPHRLLGRPRRLERRRRLDWPTAHTPHRSGPGRAPPLATRPSLLYTSVYLGSFRVRAIARRWPSPLCSSVRFPSSPLLPPFRKATLASQAGRSSIYCTRATAALIRPRPFLSRLLPSSSLSSVPDEAAFASPVVASAPSMHLPKVSRLTAHPPITFATTPHRALEASFSTSGLRQ